MSSSAPDSQAVPGPAAQATEVARKVLLTLSRQEIPVTPENYQVWFEYMLGSNPDLNKEIDELLSAGTRFDDATNHGLFEKHFGGDKERKLIKEVSQATFRILKEALEGVIATGTVTQEYSQRLNGFVTRLEQGDPDPGALKEMIEAVILDTRKVEESSTELTRQLEKARQEGNELRRKLEQAEREATRDVLTGLYNRKYLNRAIQALYDHYRQEGVPFSVIMMDIDFFKSINLDERLAVLVHECQHVILQHVFRKGERNHKLFNLAADIAINQKIKNLPEGGFYPETFDFPVNLAAEDYYELLKKEKEEQEKEKEEYEKNNGDSNGDSNGDNEGDNEENDDSNSKGDSGSEETDEAGNGWSPSNGHPDITGNEEQTLDSHELWDSLNSEDQELARDTMEKILDQAIAKSRGNTPMDVEHMMDLWKKKAVSPKIITPVRKIEQKPKEKPALKISEKSKLQSLATKLEVGMR